MTTTILTDEQIETLFREHDDLYAFCHAIAAAVLQSPEIQARMEAYAAAKVREAQQWRPIETLQAPDMEDDDGVMWATSGDVLLCDSRTGFVAQGYLEVRQSYDEGAPVEWAYLIKGGWEVIQPTHWMPLPAPPLPGPVEP